MNLPHITPDQANAVGAYLTAQGTLAECAFAGGMDLREFLEHLAAPEVQAHLTHARRIAESRARHLAAEAAESAIHTLKYIAEDPDHDKTERRRAATTLIRAIIRPSTRVSAPAKEVSREPTSATPASPIADPSTAWHPMPPPAIPEQSSETVSTTNDGSTLPDQPAFERSANQARDRASRIQQHATRSMPASARPPPAAIPN